MLARQKSHWILLGTLTVLFGVAMAAFMVSSTANRVSVALVPGTKVSLRVFRLLPAPLHLELRFNRRGWQDKRPELGSSQYNSDFRERGYLEFKQPGEPITVRVTSTAGLDSKFDALPVDAYNATVMDRPLIPSENYSADHRLAWAPKSGALLGGVLPGGATELTISVVDVGPSLAGEDVTLIVEAPVRLKQVAAGYGWLWWLYLWPVFGTILAIYFCALCWRSYRALRR
jgi:hypothetical protein